MRRGLWSAEATAKGWFEPSAYSDVAWFDEEEAFEQSIGGPAPLPHLSMVLEQRYTLTATAGTYTYTGVAASLRATRNLTCAAGSYALTGVAATLTYGSLQTGSKGPAPLPHLGLMLLYHPVITAVAGSYAITGTTTTLKSSRILTAAAGSYTMTGVAATLSKSGANGNQYPAFLPHIGLCMGTAAQWPAYLPHIGLLLATGVQANSVSYPAPLPHLSSVMGRAAGTYGMNGSPGIYTWTGQAALFRHGFQLTCDSGTFVGDFSRVARDYQITCGAGGFVMTGNAATVGRVFTLTCNAGSYTMSGKDASFRREGVGIYVLNGLAGVFDWVGSDATFAGGQRTLFADPGAFHVNGMDASYLLNGVPPATAIVAGGKGRGRRRRQFLEIEGEYIEVSDEADAIAVLSAIKEAAAQTIDKAKAPPKTTVVKPSDDAFARQLQSQVDATNAAIAKMYADAMQLERDEADIEELMTLGIL